jgi:hypothetical protein
LKPIESTRRQRIKRAQEAYIGDRANENNKVAQGTGNLLKLGR